MHPSYWQTSSSRPQFPRLSRDFHVDAVVIGAGIAGITAAYLLKKAGRTVALLERGRCLEGDTAHTTAHLTCVTDHGLSRLVKDFGRDNARAAWIAGLLAIDAIEDNAKSENIDCDFRRVPGFLCASLHAVSDDRDRQEFMAEVALANDLGFEAAYVDAVPLFNRPGLLMPNQAKFHPLKYCAGLLATIPAKGSYVCEESEVTHISTSPLNVTANGHTITCDHLVVTTHIPPQGPNTLPGAYLLQPKFAPYSTYVIGATIPKGTAPESLIWDTSDPYYYLRIDPRDTVDYAIFGGEDHKTGQVSDTEPIYKKLESALHTFLPKAVVDHRWSGRVVETTDGLPLIGELSPNVFIATGFSGQGMTFGTLSGMMALDFATGRASPWKNLFSPMRIKPIAGAVDFIKENLDYPLHMIKDRLTTGFGKTLDDVQPDTGKIVIHNNQRVAAYRDAGGHLTVLSPVCTHMGCIVAWNSSEKTWDCPCHGSRFKCTGEVVGGPAEKPLKAMESVKKA